MLSCGLYKYIITSTVMAITPSITPSTKLVVNSSRTELSEPKRETISPIWRFSKKLSGKCNKCRNKLVAICKLITEPKCNTTQPRKVWVRVCTSINKPKPKASTTNNGVSWLTKTSSTTN